MQSEEIGSSGINFVYNYVYGLVAGFQHFVFVIFVIRSHISLCTVAFVSKRPGCC